MFLRVTGNISTDIDKDGIVEIPSTSLFPGYEKEDKNKQVHATTWYAWDTKEKKFVKSIIAIIILMMDMCSCCHKDGVVK